MSYNFIFSLFFSGGCSQAVLERAQEELAKDKQAFMEKSQKLDSIMKQVQGLQ